ncbi:MAG TPA: PEGA domain-containing protein [Polyangiaceae bacterium]
MKRSAVALALVLCASSASAQDDPGKSPTGDDELARARFLDQQGVRAFGDGHVRDAMTLFQESYRAGGPPNELWNVARCQLKLDDPDGARSTLEEYLSKEGLSPQDRGEAQRLLDDLVHRASPFVAASTPAGATVSVDGHVWGLTPYTGTLPPGDHEIDIGGSSKHVEARGGRVVVVSVHLGSVEPKSHHKRHAHHTKRFWAELGALATVSSLGGGAAVDVVPAPELAFGWAPFDFRGSRIGFGVRFRAEYDTWSTSAGVSNANSLGCAPPNDYSAVELLAMPTMFGDWLVSKNVSLGARIGFGAAIYASSSPIGGDLFAPACAYGGSLAPDGYASLDVSVRLNDTFRLVFPATFDIHTAYVGTRNDGTVDASGPWMRFGLGVALAVDL